jgi:hypothetical protein
LAAIALDLKFVLDAVSRLGQMIDQDATTDPSVAEALWTSALVTYARCFAGGKRAGLPWSLFDSIHPDAPQGHRFMIDMRDKHVAHSVNPFDQVRIGAVLTPPVGSTREVVGTAILRQKLVGWDRDGLQVLWNLAREAHNYTVRRSDEVEARLLEECKGMSVDDLYNRATLRSKTPGPGDVSRARS